MKTLHIIVATTLVITLSALLVISFIPKQTHGEAFPGSAAVQITATTTVVGPGVQTIFNERIGCSARTIALSDGTGVPILFLTGDSASFILSSTTLPSGRQGLYQAGSTTVTYNGGLNGCKKWIAYAAASTTVTLVEYQ